MLQAAPSLAGGLPVFAFDHRPAPSGTIYFRGLHPDSVRNRVAGEQVLKGPERSWYGMMETYRHDLDGYVVCVGGAGRGEGRVERRAELVCTEPGLDGWLSSHGPGRGTVSIRPHEADMFPCEIRAIRSAAATRRRLFRNGETLGIGQTVNDRNGQTCAGIGTESLPRCLRPRRAAWRNAVAQSHKKENINNGLLRQAKLGEGGSYVNG